MEDRLHKLNSLYKDAESCDRELFSEQRSNWLLYVGQHFNQSARRLSTFIRGNKAVSERKGLRLVKNHLGSICDKLIGYTVLNHNPDVVIEPKNKTEVQDRTACDISNAVWTHIKDENDFDEMKGDLAADFVVGGEIASMVTWNPHKGRLLGYDADIDPVTGQVIGEPTPRFSGEVEIKRLESFNLLRDPTAKKASCSKWFIHRELVDVKELKSQFGEIPEIKERLQESAEEDFVVFDAQRGNYTKKGQEKALVKKIFYRPCTEYPEGYFVYYTSDVILAEGTLNGIFPIVFRPYQKVTTSCRGFSVIKRLRPCQLEINRIASTIAESQIYFKDKLLISSGTKISHGGQSNGVVGIKYSGAQPIPMNGQSGEKYLNVLSHQISEQYKLAHVPEEEEEKVPNADPNSLLFRSMKDKKRFSQKSDIFESFLIELCEKAIDTARLFYTEQHLVPMLAKKEHVNIAEFKNIEKVSYSLNVQAMAEDMQEMLGQQVTINHILQYSQNLPEDYIAHLVASMPFLKDSNLAEEITADVRACDDVMAAIERGEMPQMSKYDNHKFFIRKLSNKIKTSAFKFLHPQIQQMYMQRLQMHEMEEARQAEAIKSAQMGLIPSGGGLVTVSGIKDQDGNVLRLPYETIMFAVKKLNEQGTLANSIETEVQNKGAIADIAEATSLNQLQHTPVGAPQALEGF